MRSLGSTRSIPIKITLELTASQLRKLLRIAASKHTPVGATAADLLAESIIAAAKRVKVNKYPKK